MKDCLRLVVALIACILIIRCAIGPTAGTETGNPEITACLEISLSLFDSADCWLPSYYLVEGEEQLNPGKVYEPVSILHLAKRLTGSEQTPSATTDSSRGSIRIDTIIVPAKVIVMDTLVDTVMVMDTVSVTGADSSKGYIITQRIRYDSVFICDTVVKKDTFFVYIAGSDSPVTSKLDSTGYYIDAVSKNEAAVPEYIITRDTIGGRGSIIAILINQERAAEWQQSAVDLKVRSDSIFILTARQMTIGDLFVSETFSDADGDGFLTTAAFNNVPLVTGITVYRSRERETMLRVDFDAGRDGLFCPYKDNRIYALQKTVGNGENITETVRYGVLFFGQHADTVFLQRERLSVNDSLLRRTDRYVCITGADPADHRGNRLVCLTSQFTFRSRGMSGMDIKVILPLPISSGQSPEKAGLLAGIDFGKGLTGAVEAEIDYRKKSVTGRYAQAGTEYSLSYSRSLNKIELSPLQ